MQTDDGAVAAGSTEITAETIAEELSEEESFRDFITQTHAEDYEAQEGWYRWTYTVKEIDVDRIVETLKNRYEANGKLILTLKDDDYVSQNIKAFSIIYGTIYTSTRPHPVLAAGRTSLDRCTD